MEAASNNHNNQALEIAALKAQVTLLQSSWHDALQSNFRAQSLLTDPDGFVCKIMNLQKQFPDNFTAVSEARNLLMDLCDLQRQVAFTGRCIAGVTNPNASLFSDQRVNHSTSGLTTILVDTSDPSFRPEH